MSVSESAEALSDSNLTSLSKLLCGERNTSSSELDEILGHLSSSIDNVVKEISKLGDLNPDQVALYGPFLGRSILELGCTALIARLDPFRVLLLREKQKQPDYEIDRPHKSSIRWQGDVLAEKINNLWEDKSLQNPTRALLGDYYSHLIWHKSIDNLFDLINDENGGYWFEEIRKYDGKSLCARVRREIARIYSSLSKGIHHELVIPLSSTFDLDTTRELIKDSIFNVSTLGLIVTVVSHATNRLDLSSAVSTYKEIQELEIL